MTGVRNSAATLALAAALAVGTAAAASAQGLGGGTWYAKAFGGATFPSGDTTDLNGPANGRIKLDYDTGYTLGAAVGYNVMPNVALELEYAYRDADLKSPTGGDTSVNAVMANALYKFNAMGPTGQWQPYLGAGIGWANEDVSTDSFGSFTRNDAFAYQFIGGVAYNISPAWSLLGEVRWFGTDTGRLDGKNGFEFDSDFNTVDVLVGAAYNF